jgi:hypothetical protein
MFAFIRSQPDVLARLLLHIETPSIVDLLVRIIQLDEQPTGAGVLEVNGIIITSVNFMLICGFSGYRQKISWVD